jgi:hypothetical protein
VATPIRLYLENPPDLDATYADIRVERATAAAPGTFAEVATVPIDPLSRYSTYLDNAGEVDSWYRYRYRTTGALFSAYKPSNAGHQGGIFMVRAYVRAQLPLSGSGSDPELTDALIDQWTGFALRDLYGLGLWTPVTVDVVGIDNPLSPTEPTYDYDIPATVEDVYEVWELADTSLRRREIVDGWTQLGRSLRFPFTWRPSVGGTYRVTGKGYYTEVGQLSAGELSVLYHVVMGYYLRWKRDQMMNFKPFESKPRDNAIRPGDIRDALAEQEQKAMTLAARLIPEEPQKASGRAY